MLWKTAAGLALVTGCLFAGKKVVSPTTTGSNDVIDLTATISLSEDEVKQKLGADPGKSIVLVEVKVSPKGDKPVQMSPDDFILLAHDDGERSKPFEPDQIAGQGSLVLKTSAPGNAIGIERTRPTVTGLGIPLSGSKKPPAGDSASQGPPKMDDNSKSDSTLLTQLKAKQFPTKETADTVEGYLYFPLEGKHKLKNLAILYRGPTGKIDLEFEH